MRFIIGAVLVLAALGWIVETAQAHPYIAIAVGVVAGVPVVILLFIVVGMNLGLLPQTDSAAEQIGDDIPYPNRRLPGLFDVEPRRAACLEAAQNGWDIEIDYIDGQGVCTRRRVTAQSYDDETDILRGFCHLRQAERSFRADRMDTIEIKRRG